MSTNETPRSPLLARVWVQSLALVVATLLAYGSNIEGQLVWDDDMVIGPASALASAADAFRTNLFASSGAPGAGAIYYRPLVTLSYWLDVKLFAAAPHVGMHLVNLAWHGLATVLLLLVLRRWLPRDRGATNEVACFGAALLWTLTTHKAENVAWITGRGDVMGAVFILSGLLVSATRKSEPTRVATSVVATALALLCKEAMVAAPALFFADALLRVGDGAPTLRAQDHVRAALRTPTFLAALATTIAYLALRRVVLPISSGGEGMLRAVSLVDKALLFLETTGAAVLATLTPWRSELLRYPIGFHDRTSLAHVPYLGVVGAAAWVGAAVTFSRSTRYRAAIVAALGAFLPVSNLVPMGLEARLSDRFLYLPSIGVALGLALVVAAVHERRKHVALGVLVACGLVLGSRTSARAQQFSTSDTLFSYEVVHGGRAIAVCHNAGREAARAHRYREARDLNRLEVQRFQELGFRGEGLEPLIEAARNQVWSTEDEHPASQRDFLVLGDALLANRPGVVEFEFDDGQVVGIPTDSAEARSYTERFGTRLRFSIARVLARTGRTGEAISLAEQAVAACSNCTDLYFAAFEVAIAANRPELAQSWLDLAPRIDPRTDVYAALLDAQRAALTSRGPHAKALGWVAGGAFGPACREAQAHLPVGGELTGFTLAASCILAAQPELALAVAGDRARRDHVAARAAQLRFDDTARAELVRRAVAESGAP